MSVLQDTLMLLKDFGSLLKTNAGRRAALVKIDAVGQACEAGDLAVLKHWLSTDQLPNLMQPCGFRDRFPHEIACAQNHFEVLKWLVRESRQTIRLEVNDAMSLKIAAANGHLEIVQWLLAESGPTLNTRENIVASCRLAADFRKQELLRWLLETNLHAVAILEECTKWPGKIPADLVAFLEKSKAASDVLERLRVPMSDRKQYLESQICYQALLAGVVSDCRSLAKLLQSEAMHTEKRKKL